MPVTLNPTQSMTLQVQFLPTATGQPAVRSQSAATRRPGHNGGDSEWYEYSGAESSVGGERSDPELWQCDGEHGDDAVVDVDVDGDSPVTVSSAAITGQASRSLAVVCR